MSIKFKTRGRTNMTYYEFMQKINASDPEDWIYDDEKGKFVFKNDLLISILGKDIDYGESGKFYEDWATSFPDATAYRKEFELCYAGNEIETFYTAMVDGARMYLPYPKLDDMTISQNQYRLGKIVNLMNEGYGFDSYLRQANISVRDER